MLPGIPLVRVYLELAEAGAGIGWKEQKAVRDHRQNGHLIREPAPFGALHDVMQIQPDGTGIVERNQKRQWRAAAPIVRHTNSYNPET